MEFQSGNSLRSPVRDPSQTVAPQLRRDRRSSATARQRRRPVRRRVDPRRDLAKPV